MSNQNEGKNRKGKKAQEEQNKKGIFSVLHHLKIMCQKMEQNNAELKRIGFSIISK